MGGPPPEVAAVRLAVRRCLAEFEPGTLVLVACSGGPDSLALAGATRFVAPRMRLRAGAVTVDHGLQPGSAERAAKVATLLRERWLEPVEVRTVTVPPTGGIEGAARTARYAALEECARETGAAAVLLGHTRDDQAETVLLGLARGSGTRSLSGMAPSVGRYRRPLLELGRATVHRAATLMGFDPWSDPHNTDPSFARSRVRNEVLPVMERVLGPGTAEALARSARLLRDDADALDDLARDALDGATHPAGGLRAGALAELPRALRSRLLRRLAVEAGSPPGALTAGHVAELERLVTDWRGQAHIDLPGGVRGRRVGDRVDVGVPRG